MVTVKLLLHLVEVKGHLGSMRSNAENPIKAISQVRKFGFISYVVKPMFETINRMINIKPYLNNIELNYRLIEETTKKDKYAHLN